MSSTFEPKWTPGPWEPSPDYPATPIRSTIDTQQFVAGHRAAPYVEATGPDRELIALAPELAAAVLTMDDEAREMAGENYGPLLAGVDRTVYDLAERLRAIGGESC